ncbi:hypothetical protein [uncultured Celeribacter sp.]|uniref:hypothetical protein n=1 Tax=uncultured Celeribacter sp. TaxID=1303376 RepID=UPI002AA86241|nr:hypothetical protein [uncultured Celeribacter sp.]
MIAFLLMWAAEVAVFSAALALRMMGAQLMLFTMGLGLIWWLHFLHLIGAL